MSIMETAKEVEKAAMTAFQLEFQLNGGVTPIGAVLDRWEEDSKILTPRFQWFDDLLPEKFDDLAKELDTVKTELGKTSSQITAVNQFTEGWRGNAADELRAGFIAKFPTMRDNHLKLIGELEKTAAANKELFEAAQKDIVEVGKKAVEALKQSPATMGGVFDAMLTVAGIAISVTGNVTSGATGIAMVLAWAGTAKDVAGTAKQALSISGSTPAMILTSASKAIDDLHHKIDDAENKLAKILDLDYSVVTEDMEKKDVRERTLSVPAPSLTKMTTQKGHDFVENPAEVAKFRKNLKDKEDQSFLPPVGTWN